MLVYTQSKFKPKKKRNVRGIIAVKFNAARYMDKKSTYIPSYTGTPPRSSSEAAMRAPSRESNLCYTGRNNVMEPMQLAKESPEVRAAIIAKSRRIAIAYNKGAYQFITEGTDLKTIGSGERLRRG